MGLMGPDYRRQLQALLPIGTAWPRHAAATLTRFLDAAAEEFARIHARRDALFEEADPRTTTELLPDWERVAGLPDNCSGVLAETVQDRRNDLVAKLSSTGGATAAYLTAAALAAGYVIEIQELYGTPNEFKVITSANAQTYFTADASFADEPLVDWGNNTLECLINQLKPAHTSAVFVYVDEIAATGGTITEAGGYRIHTFTSSGSFDVTTGGDIQYLVVGGGGAGGTMFNSGGGGGGGEVVQGTATVTPGSYAITVGAGGVSGSLDGAASSLDVIATAEGGGRGANVGPGTDGAGGGGGAGANTLGTNRPGGDGSPGGDGGTGFGHHIFALRSAGGGGGAGAAGGNAAAGVGGAGGAGTPWVVSGSTKHYGGGGGGATRGDAAASGGVGGGGHGGYTGTPPEAQGADATPNTGGGGGGSVDTEPPSLSNSSGAAGVVIIRYLI